MIWGCFNSNGVGRAYRIEGRMDASRYTQILDTELIGSIQEFGQGIGDIVFQQDNDPKHTSRLARDWFQAKGIALLDWPAQSPDLNPIEHLWGFLKRAIADYDYPAESIYQLWERVEREWARIPPQICAALVNSMPRRIRAVIKAKGGYTKY